MTTEDLQRLWRMDLYRYYGRDDARTWARMLFLPWETPGFRYTFLLRLCAYLHACRPLIPLYILTRLLLTRLEYKYGITISPTTRVGGGLYIGHFGGIVIHPGAVIGENCNISQGVTIGQSPRGARAGYPTLGDRVFLGPNAIVIGRIVIGSNVAIGAGCVVTHDAPVGAVIAGVPGKVISSDGAEGYITRVHPKYAIAVDSRASSPGWVKAARSRPSGSSA